MGLCGGSKNILWQMVKQQKQASGSAPITKVAANETARIQIVPSDHNITSNAPLYLTQICARLTVANVLNLPLITH